MHALEGRHILITGGAGFIGSNIVNSLLSSNVKVTVFDNLATGHKSNIEMHLNNPLFRFIEGDICNYDQCLAALESIDVVSHQAALGSVPRSIALPHNTHDVNATGFLNMLHACKEKGIKRFVYASSSSVYGDSTISPKTIGSEGKLLSPYAVTKQLNEMYANVYNELHGMETIGLRYFNIFGPNQDPNGVYAAAIPKFIDAMIHGKTITINGDGEQTRDFTFVENAVNANILGLSTPNDRAFGNVFNVACGNYYSLNQVIIAIRENLEKSNLYNESTQIVYGPNREGDIRDSLADISQTNSILGYTHPILFEEGMRYYCDWYSNQL